MSIHPAHAKVKAREMGATVEEGINWTWAKDFPSPEVAQEFLQFLNDCGYEHRGYYPAIPDAPNPNHLVDGIRFR